MAPEPAVLRDRYRGALHGEHGWPQRWRDDLEYHDELLGLADGLAELAAAGCGSQRSSRGG